MHQNIAKISQCVGAFSNLAHWPFVLNQLDMSMGLYQTKISYHEIWFDFHLVVQLSRFKSIPK